MQAAEPVKSSNTSAQPQNKAAQPFFQRKGVDSALTTGQDFFAPKGGEGSFFAPTQFLVQKNDTTPLVQRQVAAAEAPASEHPESGRATESASPAPDSQFDCDPQPVSHADFLTQASAHGFSPNGAFGITILNGRNVTLPQVQLDSSRRLSRTSTAVSIFSVYLSGGQIFEDERRRTVPIPAGVSCGSDIIHYGIMTDGAAKIREGEQEHCSDFRLAFEVSLVRYMSAVNRLASRRRRFRDLDAANAQLQRDTGVHPDDWAQTFIDLSTRTRLRDTRLHHSAPVGAVSLHPSERRCLFPMMRITARLFPEIGVHSSRSILRIP